MDSKTCPPPEYALIEASATHPVCGQPTDDELFGVTTLSCCDEHPTTYIGVLCRPSKCTCHQASLEANDPSYELFIPSAAIAMRHTIQPCHAWMPVHLSYEHLACMRKHLVPDIPSKKTIVYEMADLEVAVKKMRETKDITIAHRLMHQLKSLRGDFIQFQDSNVRVELKEKDSSLYNDEFVPCRHYTIKLSSFKLKSSKSILGRKRYVVGHIGYGSAACGFDDSRDWDSLGGVWSCKRACEICETQWICKIEKIEAVLHVFFSCIRKLGHGRNLSGDSTWISAVSGQGTKHRQPSSFDLYNSIYPEEESFEVIGESKIQRVLGGVRNVSFHPQPVGDIPLSPYELSEARFFNEWKF